MASFLTPFFSTRHSPAGFGGCVWTPNPVRTAGRVQAGSNPTLGAVACDSDPDWNRSSPILALLANLAHSCSSLLVLAGCCGSLPVVAGPCRLLSVSKTVCSAKLTCYSFGPSFSRSFCELAPAFRASRPLYSIFKYNCINCRLLIEPLGHAIQSRI